MSIVTKKGDTGHTSLYGGVRVLKSAARVDAYGEVDELNAFLGFARALAPGAYLEAILKRIQGELLTVGALLAMPPDTPLTTRLPPLSLEWAEKIEAEVKEFEKVLMPLKQFIVPGGPPVSAALHMARTVARKAERKVVALSQQEEVPQEIFAYLNRLSDLLFIMARVSCETSTSDGKSLA